MTEEIIVVQSKGMERWLAIQLAQRLGICSNFRFPFPNAFVDDIFKKVLRELPEYPSFDPAVTTWQIMDLLPSLVDMPGFEIIKRYLGDGSDDLKLFQLSERIADLFDQYMLFRPQMVFGWENGADNHWQAILFRELLGVSGKRHRAAFGRYFLERLNGYDAGKKEIPLPERVSVFGISALPGFYMEIFAALANKIPVNLFLINPCREYWGDILSEWEIKRRTRRGDISYTVNADLYMEKGNSLLASLGKLGRDFFDLISELNCEEVTCFEDNDGDSLLSSIQSDILNLRDVSYGVSAKRAIDKYDTSIQIHSCHSPMREIEVLHDRLLEMFERDPDLKPGDILVMTPDIELYAPFIQAVFSAQTGHSKMIPFSIADRSIRKQSDLIDAFFTILGLEGSRFGASNVLGVLECPSVRRRFGITVADLGLIVKWVKTTRIRWGINGESRKESGLPPFEENTWQAGLKRLLLGYAMPGRGRNMFGNILPYDHIEGADALILGRFVEFTDRLFSCVLSLKDARSLDEWAGFLEDILGSLFMPDEEEENEAQIIRHALDDLKRMKELTRFDRKIPVHVIRHHLEHSIEGRGGGSSGFITGGVTFCAMLPMRSIPFKIICLVGMNNDAYPRDSKVLDFDLIAKHPKPGDRSRRNDDRYLFLETILSARKGLYISYTGQDIRDNSMIPPSVLVTELLDYIFMGFHIPGEKILDRIVTRHRLQPFNPEYFRKNSKLFSYSEEHFRAALELLKERRPPSGFIHKGLSLPDEMWKKVHIDDLYGFFVNPARFLMERRLRVYLRRSELPVEDVEPLKVEGLEKYRLEQEMVKKRFAGWDYRDIFDVARAEGSLPHGNLGESIFDTLRIGTESFVEKSLCYMEGDLPESFDFDVSLADFRLTGTINNLYAAGLVQYRYARIGPADRLGIWIRHLLLNIVRGAHSPCTSILVGLSTESRYPEWTALKYGPLENSEKILEDLLNKYWHGLMVPLNFFPKASWEYFNGIFRKNMSHEEALRKAYGIWAGNERIKGECEDAYYKVCFGDRDPLDAEFARIAEEIFFPLAAHEIEVEK